MVYNEELDYESDKICVYLPLSNKKLISLQENNAQVLKIQKQLGNPIRKSYFLDKNDILKKYLDNKNQMFYQYVVQSAMVHAIMTTSHDNSGHNEFRRTSYNGVKRHYFWHRMKKDILKYCKHCTKCDLYKTQKYESERKKHLHQAFNPWNSSQWI